MSRVTVAMTLLVFAAALAGCATTCDRAGRHQHGPFENVRHAPGCRFVTATVATGYYDCPIDFADSFDGGG